MSHFENQPGLKERFQAFLQLVCDLLTSQFPFVFFATFCLELWVLSVPLALQLPYVRFTGSSFNPLSKSPMFPMFSTAPAATMTNVSKGFTGQKPKYPMFMRILTGLRLQTPKRVGPPIILINLNRSCFSSLTHFSPLFAPIRRYSLQKNIASALPFANLPFACFRLQGI